MTAETSEIQPSEAQPSEAQPSDDWTPHLEELRRRVIAVLVVFFVATLAAFAFSSHIAAFLTAPLAAFHVALYTFAPAEKFMAYLHLSAWTGLICAAPYVCMQAALFLWPGLRREERRCASCALFVAPVLFLLGAALCYRFMAPIVFGFFLSFGEGDGVQALWGLKEYLTLLFDLMLAAGLLLQTPLLLLATFALGIVKPKTVARFRPHIIVLIFLAAALCTPPDVVSQVALGVPLYLLFELTLAVVRVFK